MAKLDSSNKQTEEIRVRLGPETTLVGEIIGTQSSSTYDCLIRYFEMVRDQYRAAEKASAQQPHVKEGPQPVAKVG